MADTTKCHQAWQAPKAVSSAPWWIHTQRFCLSKHGHTVAQTYVPPAYQHPQMRVNLLNEEEVDSPWPQNHCALRGHRGPAASAAALSTCTLDHAALRPGLVLPEDLDPSEEEPSLRVVPMPTFLRELAGALDDVELAEEGLLPSTESSSSKFLSEE